MANFNDLFVPEKIPNGNECKTCISKVRNNVTEQCNFEFITLEECFILVCGL